MESIELIRGNLRNSQSVALARIEDMREHGMVCATPNGGAHTLWLLGHLAFIEVLVIRRYMLGEENPLAAWEELFDGDEVSADAEQFPSFDDVLELCRGARAATIELLDTLTEDDLDRESANYPEVARDLFGTWRSCFQMVADHWLMHRGQIADARRAAGLTRAWY